MGIRDRHLTRPRVVEEYVSLPGRLAEGLLVVSRGHWSNADVYLTAPDVWGEVNAAQVRVYSLQGHGRAQLLSADLWLTPFTQNGGGWRTWLVGSVRGRPSDGFEVTANAPRGTDLPGAWVALETWGTESTPEAMAASVEQNVTLRAGELSMPRRAAHLMYYESVSRTHRLVQGDALGRLRVIAIQEQLGSGGQNDSGGFVSSVVARSFGVKARWAQMVNQSAGVRWFQVFDSSTLPNAGDKCRYQRPVAAGSFEEYQWPGDGWQAFSGLTFACSTTADVYTAAPDGWFACIAKE